MNASISVAMTTYNGIRYLKAQLDSLFAQTCPPMEVIVCDDGSTDGTVGFLQQYAREEPRLKPYFNDVGLGVNDNFLKAMSLCRGAYVMLCDQDDVWLPDKIQASFNALRSAADCELVTSRALPVDVSGKPLCSLTPRKDNRDGKWTILGHTSQGCTLLMKRSLVERVLAFDRPGPGELLDPATGKQLVYFDWMIGLLAAFEDRKLDLAKPLMHYRIHPGNVTADPDFYRGGSWRVRLERWLKRTRTGYEAYVLYQPKRRMMLEWVYRHCGGAVLPQHALLVEQILRLHDAPSLRTKRKILRQLPKDYPIRLRVLAYLKWLRHRG